MTLVMKKQRWKGCKNAVGTLHTVMTLSLTFQGHAIETVMVLMERVYASFYMLVTQTQFCIE